MIFETNLNLTHEHVLACAHTRTHTHMADLGMKTEKTQGKPLF